MKIRSILVQLIDSCYREPLMKLKVAREKGFSFCEKENGQLYIFMVDGRTPHGGMFDRLKGLITIYAISKALGKDFRINWNYPFALHKYLEPSHYNWMIDELEINFGLLSHNNIIAYGEFFNPNRLMKNRRKETHFYYGYDSLNEVNKVRVMIASDSMIFIDRIRKELPMVYIVPGKVKHIDTAGETEDSENIKMFTDYYLISGAQKVYSLWHKGMWNSAFPEYAARIGNVPFVRINF